MQEYQKAFTSRHQRGATPFTPPLHRYQSPFSTTTLPLFCLFQTRQPLLCKWLLLLLHHCFFWPSPPLQVCIFFVLLHFIFFWPILQIKHPFSFFFFFLFFYLIRSLCPSSKIGVLSILLGKYSYVVTNHISSVSVCVFASLPFSLETSFIYYYFLIYFSA